MTLRIIEGFDHSGVPSGAAATAAALAACGWRTGGTYQSPCSFFTSRWGASFGKAVKLTGYNALMYKVLPAGFPEVWMGCAAALGSRANAPFIYILNAASAGCCYISTTGAAGGFINLHNAAGTIVATTNGGSNYIWDGAWHYVEMRCFANGASGTAEVWVDGVQVIPSTVSNYGTGTGLAVPAGVYFIASDSPSASTWYDIYIDDVYFLDTGTGTKTTRLGECRVETLWPTADGAHSDFVPTTAGTHFDEVDDPILNDADSTVVQSNVVGARDSFAFQDMSISSGLVHGVGVKTVARKNDVTARSIKHSVRQGGTTYDGSLAHLLTASHATFQTVWEQDPTGTNWTIANVNGDEFGVKVEA